MIINAHDKISIKDRVSPDCGYVEILEKGTKNLLASQNNLITWAGRRWLMHRALNLQDTLVPGPGEIDPLQGYIFYFGLGSGGAIPPTSLTPIPPTSQDTALLNQLPIYPAFPFLNVESPPGTFQYAGLTGLEGRFKKMTLADFSDVNTPVQLESELAVKLQCDVDNLECVLSPAGANVTNYINEAGIFVSKKDDPLSFILFSRITFSTIAKDIVSNNRGFTINWHFLF